MNQVEEDLLEADAKNRLYYLLGERTRREHMSIDQKVSKLQPHTVLRAVTAHLWAATAAGGAV